MRGLLVRSCVVGTALACALSGAVAVSHCASFTGDESGADGAVGPDAAADGGADASVVDDARSALDAGPPPFGSCATALAEDFEQLPVASPMWPMGVQASGGASVALDTTDPFAGTSSLRIDVPGVSTSAYLKALLGARARVRFAFAVKLGPAVGRTVHLNTVELSTQESALFFSATDGVMTLVEQHFDADAGNPISVHPLGAAALTGWHRYALTLTMAATMVPHAIVEIDGYTVTELDLSLLRLVPGSADVRVGVVYSSNGPAVQLWLDDVEVCAEP